MVLLPLPLKSAADVIYIQMICKPVHQALKLPLGNTPKHINEQCLQPPCPSYGFHSQTYSTTKLYHQGRLPLYVVHDLRAHHARRYVAISHVRSQTLPMWSLVNRLNPSLNLYRFGLIRYAYRLRHPVNILLSGLGTMFFRRADVIIVLEYSVCNTQTRSVEQNMIEIKDYGQSVKVLLQSP